MIQYADFTLRNVRTDTFDPARAEDVAKYRILRKLASIAYVRRGMSKDEIAITPKEKLWSKVGQILGQMGFEGWEYFDHPVPIRDEGRLKNVTPCGFQAWASNMLVRSYAGTQDPEDARSDIDIAPHPAPWGGHISDGVEDYRLAFTWSRQPEEFDLSYIVGHSLGGMTAENEFRHLQLARIHVECWTFGQAAIHDYQSARTCAQNNRGYNRFAAGRDIVSSFGWEPDYTPKTSLGKKWLCHSGPAHRIDYQGRFLPLRGLDKCQVWRGVADHSIDGVYAKP